MRLLWDKFHPPDPVDHRITIVTQEDTWGALAFELTARSQHATGSIERRYASPRRCRFE
jgi:hypothetical protein